jgi:hypothetical protein
MNKIVLGALWPVFISIIKSSGRAGFLRMIAISEKDLAKIQKKNGDSLDDAITKRDAWLEATADFVEELANLDDD